MKRTPTQEYYIFLDLLENALREVRGKNPESVTRHFKIYREWLTGKTFSELGRAYNLSGTRIRQIVLKVERRKHLKNTQSFQQKVAYLDEVLGTMGEQEKL